jgi:hypothetical protein
MSSVISCAWDGRKFLELVVPEVAVPHAGREHQTVVGHRDAVPVCGVDEDRAPSRLDTGAGRAHSPMNLMSCSATARGASSAM